MLKLILCASGRDASAARKGSISPAHVPSTRRVANIARKTALFLCHATAGGCRVRDQQPFNALGASGTDGVSPQCGGAHQIFGRKALFYARAHPITSAIWPNCLVCGAQLAHTPSGAIACAKFS